MLLCILLETLYSTIQQSLESTIEKLSVNRENYKLNIVYAHVLFLQLLYCLYFYTSNEELSTQFDI